MAIILAAMALALQCRQPCWERVSDDDHVGLWESKGIRKPGGTLAPAVIIRTRVVINFLMGCGTSSRILVVGREERTLGAMRRYLGLYCYEVDCATRIEEAKSLLAEAHYSILIIDERLDEIEDLDRLNTLMSGRQEYPWMRVFRMDLIRALKAL